MNEYVELVNNQLRQYVEKLNMPQTLKDSMAYSIRAGGKRIRPLLLFATLNAFKKDISLGLPAACALEMIHTYSLIHDDLPAMDNDDLRRGKPTNHKVFGEAVAILAGDALLTYSFQILSEMNENLSSDQKINLIAELAKAAGPEGMVGGQTADMEGENKQLTLAELQYIHLHKTGKLLSYAIKAGAIIANASKEIIEELERFAYHIGIAFQIKDDILDVEGSTEMLGKTAGIDITNNKSTYPSLLTLEGAKDRLIEHVNTAKDILQSLPIETEQLLAISDLIGERDY